MPYQRFLYFSFLAISIVSLNFQCNKDIGRGDIPYKYNFKENISLTPYQLNYKVGDTIWLSINIPDKKVFDETSNSRILYDTVSFTSFIQVSLVYNNPFIEDGAFARFVYPQNISAYSNIGGGQTSTTITFGCTQSKDYSLQLGIVLIAKGAFSISAWNSAVRQCQSGYYDNTRLTYAFNVTDTHKSFYQQLPLSNVGKKQDEYLLQNLDAKRTVVINVQ